MTTSLSESEEQTKEIAQLKKTQDKLAESLRLSLHYFSPPSWPTKKEDLIGLGLDQLLEFPLVSYPPVPWPSISRMRVRKNSPANVHEFLRFQTYKISAKIPGFETGR